MTTPCSRRSACGSMVQAWATCSAACARIARRIHSERLRVVGFVPSNDKVAVPPLIIQLGLALCDLTGATVAVVDANVRYPGLAAARQGPARPITTTSVFSTRWLRGSLALLSAPRVERAGEVVPQLARVLLEGSDLFAHVLVDLTGFELLGEHAAAAACMDAVALVGQAHQSREHELRRARPADAARSVPRRAARRLGPLTVAASHARVAALAWIVLCSPTMRTLEQEKIAVIGLGYVGLPVALSFGRKLPTVGFDIRQRRVDELKKGHDETLEVTAEQLAAADQARADGRSGEARRLHVLHRRGPDADRQQQPPRPRTDDQRVADDRPAPQEGRRRRVTSRRSTRASPRRSAARSSTRRAASRTASTTSSATRPSASTPATRSTRSRRS